MRGLVLCGLLSLLAGVKPLADGVSALDAKAGAVPSAAGSPSKPVAGGFAARKMPRADPASLAADPGVDCTAIVIDTKPPVDLGMAQPIAGNPDSTMVVPSPCRK